MGKLFSFFRRWWIVLGIAGLMLVLTTVLVLVSSSWFQPEVAPEIDEAIADYGQRMAKKPSAKTAGEMLDLAMESGKDQLVFTALHDHIHPWTETKGVLDVFVRGSRRYINFTGITDNVLWLEEEIRKLAPEADLNEDLANYYTKRMTGIRAVEYGNKLFANWTLNQAARIHYLNSIKTLWANSALPIQRGGEFPGVRLTEQFPLHRVDLEEFKDVPLYLQIWKNCWRGSLDQEFSDLLNQLSPESDPLDLYWSIWAVALLRDLEPGWQNPLGLDVASRISEVVSNIGKDQQSSVFDVLYANRDPASNDQNLTLLDLLTQSGLAKDYGHTAAVLLLNAAGYEFSDLEKPVYTDQDRIEFPSEVQSRYTELSDILASDPYFKKLDFQLIIPDSALKLQKSMDFYVQHEIRFSNSHPAALIMSDEGLTLLDIINLKETTYPDYWGSWSAKGDKFALIKAADGNATIRIISADGQELERYALQLEMPILHENGRVFVTTVRWYSPWELTIAYTALGLFYDEYPDSRAYRFNMTTETLTDISEEESWESYDYLPGTDLYYGLDIINSSGEKAGDILEVSSDWKSVEIPEEGAKLYIQGQELLLKTAQTTLTVMNNVDDITWAAVSGGKIYAKIYLDPSQTADGYRYRYISINILTGAAAPLSPGYTWCDDAEFVARSSNLETRVTSAYFRNEWLLLETFEGEGYGDNISLHVDGVPLPVVVPCGGAVRMYKSGDSYILVAIQLRIYYMLDVSGSVLIFN